MTITFRVAVAVGQNEDGAIEDSDPATQPQFLWLSGQPESQIDESSSGPVVGQQGEE